MFSLLGGCLINGGRDYTVSGKNDRPCLSVQAPLLIKPNAAAQRFCQSRILYLLVSRMRLRSFRSCSYKQKRSARIKKLPHITGACVHIHGAAVEPLTSDLFSAFLLDSYSRGRCGPKAFGAEAVRVSEVRHGDGRGSPSRCMSGRPWHGGSSCTVGAAPRGRDGILQGSARE